MGLHVDDGHGDADVAAGGGLEGAEQDFHDLTGFGGAAGGGAAVADEVEKLDDSASDVALGVLGVGDVGGDELARVALGGDGGAFLGDAQDALGAEDVDVEDARAWACTCSRRRGRRCRTR